MTEYQNIASNPKHSAWVSASAGTGKTKVLIDRVLRLLLTGVSPEKILCITYTKAAASEMQNRINSKLSQWVIADETALKEQITNLTKQPPIAKTIQRARTLFATVLESSDGVRIQTIHSFCETILKKFPQEAGIPSHFQIIDDATANEMIDDTIIHLINEKQNQPLQEAIQALSLKFNADSFKDTLKGIIVLKDKFKTNETWLLKNKIREILGVKNPDKDEYIKTFCEQINREKIRQFANVLNNGTKTEIARADSLYAWLDNPDFNDYKAIFLTQKGEPRKSLMGKKSAEIYTNMFDFALQQQEQVLTANEHIKTIDILHITEHLLTVADYFLTSYEAQKQAKGLLDYADLIIITNRLLQQSAMSSWVLYKLDGGIEHLLLDEAQDTSPDQWEVISALIEDWFAGETSSEKERTIFVVGDKKQSIYSFQGAAPDIFLQKKEEFREMVQNAGKAWQDVPLDLSFRSTLPVLQLVDSVFNRDLTGISDEPIQHVAHRKNDAGRAEIL